MCSHTVIATSYGKRITETNAGCRVELTCVGWGTMAAWRIFGDRKIIVTRGNIIVVVRLFRSIWWNCYLLGSYTPSPINRIID